MGFKDKLLGPSPPGNGLYKDKDALRTATKPESPPPSYNPEDLITPLTNLNLAQPTAQQPPSIDQCITHLKLLTALANLREDISTAESLFGLSDSLAEKLSDQDKQEVLPKIREKRWQVYVSRAVERFRVWWEKCLPSSGRMLQQQDLSTQGHFDLITQEGKVINWGPDRAPPLDVLMVLHSFMLNPRAFFEDCIRQGKMDVWATGLPWQLINTCIDNSSFDYVAIDEARSNFEQMTGLAWDNLHDPPAGLVPCPRGHPIYCPWTDAFVGDPKRPFEQGKGYADRSFTATCEQCNFTTNHEILKLQKFRRDLQALLKDDVPMPGTILSQDGKPDKALKSDLRRHEMFFPNRIIIAGLKTLLIEVTDNIQVGKSTVMDIRDAIDRAIRDPSLVRKANGTFSTTLLRKEKIAIRRMMSRYWDNWSPFALDLVGAVMRQGTFVEKMANIDWIHSPALASTMARLIKKYQTFFLIMAGNPNHVAVPTLDVDLAWHTHQLSPARYYSYSVAKTNVFIDHDDKIEETKLSDAFKWTSRMYQKLTGGEIYSECTCWYCEAIRESHTSTAGRLFSSSDRNAQTALNQLHDNPGVSGDPNKNAHISAHNAVKTDSAAASTAAAVKAAQLEASYQKACRRAKKRGRDPPVRDDYMFGYYAWGYPLYYPGLFYAPYMAPIAITGDMYPCNPSCMSATEGVAGNCCQGTCGAGVAAGGSCGGASGACAGGSAGGCGGGGCGGGGCGGGGGGCGGGGGGGCGGGGGN
ncbi:hypothetical protein LIPSTDRAFT_309963 [Lipomyces starkeyi NRRL Y-11557]|uniref:Alpha-ketoglutarate-dependent sulfonate dioxygenase n=1 Tax=Lipomyces starkeyi NRRL Y-11557 TaxID=675824 RepID=A0A1E3Q2F6_LIPST|nr:hypothetical protein LIPSTDRAFT_309963 [Lipomyces starkeyi NRRL Y-11557]